ncbi:hypothetical protein RIVM261_051340 [Rivularia sp. IAM M-261]|nr:hypothetical protein CAL7716_004670 [Calothrix sp. PCC 7716]GJD20178.1 hypothetical protein RIVM261_051340 [Rivularia sp. IAM M-261]
MELFASGSAKSIGALDIQLRTANTLLHIDLEKAQRFLVQSHQLSSSVMQEVRQVVKALAEDAKLPLFS